MLQKFPKPPKHLSREAKSLWKKLVSRWVLDEAGLVLLESALEAFDRMRGAQEAVAKDGAFIKDRFDQLRAHPAIAVERDAKGVLLRNLKALGLDIEPLHAGPGRPGGHR
jgi:P27 family predicted phage terminase small subunit